MPGEERRERGREVDPGERRPEAVMGAVAEAGGGVAGAAHPEAVRVADVLGVPERGEEGRDHRLTGADGDAPDLDVLEGDARVGEEAVVVVPQDLLDGSWNEQQDA